MIAGVPGTGIGGLFYLIVAVFMPVREFYLKIRKRDDVNRWQIIKRHYLLTICIILGMLITGWLLGWLIEAIIPTNVISGNSGPISTSHVQNVIRISTLLITLFTLIIVYMNMHVLRIIFKAK